MKRYLFALAALSLAFIAPAQADLKFSERFVAQIASDTADYSTAPKNTTVAQSAPATTNTQTTTSTPTAPASVTTTVKGGTLAADVLQWIQVALAPILGAAIIGLIVKGMSLIGIQTTAQQSEQLARIAVNGINDAMSKAQAGLRGSTAMDISLKGKLMADAVAYTQEHAKETLNAMGLDPKSGKATEAIRAKIETALNDPAKATPAEITPKAAGGLA